MAHSVFAVFLSFLLCPILGVFAAPDITSVTPTGVGASNPLASAAAPTPTIRLVVSPTVVSTCQNLSISWTIDNDSISFDITPITLLYSNFDVPQTTPDPPPQENTITILSLSARQYTWLVSLTDPGSYVINATIPGSNPTPVVVQSSPWQLVSGDSSCLTSNAPSQSQSSNPSPTQSHSSNVGAIVGGVIGGLVIVAVIVVFWLLARRRNKLSSNLAGLNTGRQSNPGKGHQRKWGGLTSIDKLQQGEIPVVIPSNSPYASPTYNYNQSRSTGHAMTDEEGIEKGYGKDIYPVDADILSEMPTLDSNRTTQRYSFDTMGHAMRSSGGPAAHDEDRVSSYKPTAAAPVLTTMHVTYNGGDDPFSDSSFSRRTKRASALSVPSTARAPSRLSDASVRPTTSPISPPTPSGPTSPTNALVRNTSAGASLGRPARKPVPQYNDDSFELTNTSKSSPPSHSPLTHHPNRSNGGADTSPNTPSRNSPTDSSTHWLQDRAPVANRNIGLAGQGEGPVHYLMPDLPPSGQ